MKKLFLLFFVFFCTNITFAQKTTKTETICHKVKGEGSCLHTDYFLANVMIFNENMEIESHNFGLLVQDDDYDCLDNHFEIIQGSAQEVYDFLIKIESLFEKLTSGMSITEGDYSFRRFKYLTANEISVGKVDSKKTHSFSKNNIKKIKKKLIAYCEQNNIKIEF